VLYHRMFKVNPTLTLVNQAEAVLLHLGVSCTGTAFEGRNACGELFDFVEAYFADPGAPYPKTGVHKTSHPPIFLQRPNHSITIVGIERLRSGKRRLLTFDPAYRPPSVMLKSHADGDSKGWAAQRALWRYRKVENSLKRFTMFETLTVDKAM